MDLWLERLLVWGADAGELGDLALAGLLVQALGIALLGNLDGNVDPHLDKGQARLAAGTFGVVQTASQIAVRSVGGNEAGDGDGAAVGEELGHLGDAADVFLAFLGAEAQVLVEAEADVVTVQTVGVLVVRFADESLLERHGDGGLARGRKTRQPDGQAGLLEKARSDGRGQRTGVEMNVSSMGRQSKHILHHF